MYAESLILTLSINEDVGDDIQKTYWCIVCDRGDGSTKKPPPERVIVLRNPDSDDRSEDIRLGIHLACAQAQQPQWVVSSGGTQINQYATTTTVTLNQKLRQKAE